VLAADTPDGLRTCALRPGGVWGNDTGSMMIKSFLTQFATGKFTALIGNGKATMDNTHVDNLVDAQLLAAKNLRSKKPYRGRPGLFHHRRRSHQRPRMVPPAGGGLRQTLP